MLAGRIALGDGALEPVPGKEGRAALGTWNRWAGADCYPGGPIQQRIPRGQFRPRHVGPPTKLVAQTFLLGLLACDARYPSWAPKTLGISGGRNPGFRTSSGISTKRHASPSACTMYVVLDGTRGVHDPTPFLSYLACADRSAESAGLRLVRLWSFPLTTVHAVTGLMRGHADGLRPAFAQPPTQDGHRRQGVTVLELFRVPICADMHRDCHSRVTSALASSSASSVASGKGLDVAALVIVS